ncbi:ABC transporter substrate-binding protein [Arvimicrobium flavum]|uniref:ABC transporter substrate-binding protein n=1 Tax=Arvimicrobium flavum TaxID=3393320 RepID=UPI00237B590F|nr:extracellular solute-binding protein [Mesorhizobium shangrilense]
MSKLPFVSRRQFLKSSSAAMLAGGAGLSLPMSARAAETIHFSTWSAAVDLVQSHISAFEAANPDVKISYSNAPWAQYRESSITKFVGGAPMDMLWVSDTWLPEWAEAGWLAPIDQYDALTKYNADTDDFSLQSMMYGGKQYGLTYYNDYIAFLYNAEILEKAGIQAPPATWEEVIEQSKIIKEKGLSDAPLMIGMAQESWLVEFLSTLVFSHGGRLVDDEGNAVMADPQGGAVAAATWLKSAVDAGVLPASCVETGELACLKSFGAGQNAFTMVAKYRLRMLNDPAQSPAAGKIKQALMPKGGANGTNETVGYIRFYGMTPGAQETEERAAAVVKLMEWFGGKANGEYVLQKLLFKDLGLGFATKSLFDDPEIRDGYSAFADVDLVSKQQSLARKKDVIAPWFGEWNDVNGTAWQRVILGQATPEEALKASGETWDKLKKSA